MLNALIEALTCGLPAVFRKSGGHPELVGGAGFGFDAKEQIPELLEKVARDYDAVRARVTAPCISEIAADYLKIMGAGPAR